MMLSWLIQTNHLRVQSCSRDLMTLLLLKPLRERDVSEGQALRRRNQEEVV